MKRLNPRLHLLISKAIRQRRSIRRYADSKIPLPIIKDIIKAGSYAPSGLNNQPWRFVAVLDQRTKENIAQLTHYAHIIRKAAALIVVFLDVDASYHRQKDHHAIGACIQNMLLAAYGYGIGTCWLGEILKSSLRLRQICAVRKSFEAQAVITLGYPAETPRMKRKPLDSLILKIIM